MNPSARSSLSRLKRKRKKEQEEKVKQRDLLIQASSKKLLEETNNDNEELKLDSALTRPFSVSTHDSEDREGKEEPSPHQKPHSKLYHPPERQYSEEQTPIFLDKQFSDGDFLGKPEIDDSDFEKHSPGVQRWIIFSRKCSDFVYSNAFSALVTIFIILAGILVGVQTYDSTKDIVALEVLDWVILAVFGLEAILKICAEELKPWNYFIGKEWRWNNFDFWIVLFGLPIWGTNSSVSFLRLLRLLRIVKLFKKVNQLQIIVMGLIGGISSIGYILLLLTLVFYLYAIAGIYAFRTNDPWHFGSLPIALVTLFRSSTLEDWSDIMYINLWGCDEYDAGMYLDPSEADDGDREYFCDDPTPRQIVAPAFFITFIVISALVMLSLFVGAVTMSMASSMEELKKTKEEEEKKKRTQKAAKRLLKAQKVLDGDGLSVRSGRSPQSNMSSYNSGFERSGNSLLSKNSEIEHKSPEIHSRKGKIIPTNDIEENKNNKNEENDTDNKSMRLNIESNINHNLELNEKKEKYSFRSSIENPFASLSFTPKNLLRSNKLTSVMKRGEKKVTRKQWQEMRHVQALLRAAWGDISYEDILTMEMDDEGMDDFDPVSKAYYRLSLICERITTSQIFQTGIIIVILLAGVLVGIQTNDRLMRDDATEETVFILDWIVLAIFTVEAVLKIVAEGFDPAAYFKNGWNLFDFLIVVGSYQSFGDVSLLTMLRLLRLLRVLKLIKSLPQLAVIVNAMIMGMSSIGYIGVILFLTFYIFAILGMILFRSNDPWHFGSLHITLLTLFRCSTLEDWSDVMYTNMYGCRNYGYDDWPEDCTNSNGQPFLAILYFVSFTVIAAAEISGSPHNLSFLYGPQFTPTSLNLYGTLLSPNNSSTGSINSIVPLYPVAIIGLFIINISNTFNPYPSDLCSDT